MPTSSGGTAYSDQQVYQFLLRSGLETFTFDWLSSERVYLGDLTPYVDLESPARLNYDPSQAVPRSLSFRTVGKPGRLNPLTDLIRPHYRLLAPDGGWLDWTLGTLALKQPRKTITEGASYFDWTAVDLLNWLVQDNFGRSFSLPGGTDAIVGIKTILSSFHGPALAVLIPGSNRSLSLRNSISWDPDKSRLEAVNDLLGAVGYRPVWADENGDLRSMELPDYNLETAAWSWDAASGNSVMLADGFTEDPNDTEAINYCAVIGEDPRQDPNSTTPPVAVFAEYENTRPDSPISTAGLKGRRIAKVIHDSKITDNTTAKLRARAEVQAGAQNFAKFQVPTLAWPAWADGGYPLIHLTYSGADEGNVDAIYLVSGWSWVLAPGEPTVHILQRVVGV